MHDQHAFTANSRKSLIHFTTNFLSLTRFGPNYPTSNIMPSTTEPPCAHICTYTNTSGSYSTSLLILFFFSLSLFLLCNASIVTIKTNVYKQIVM